MPEPIHRGDGYVALGRDGTLTGEYPAAYEWLFVTCVLGGRRSGVYIQRPDGSPPPDRPNRDECGRCGGRDFIWDLG